MSDIKFGAEYWVAVISLLMYSILLIASVYQYVRHRGIDVSKARSNFNQCKLSFFAILAVSSAASIPLWLACVARAGPDDCQWNGPGYAFCWSLHLIALTGYSCCVGIPTIMWSDIVNGYNHKSFFKSFCDRNIDSTRVCFLIFVVSYLLNELLTVVSMIIWMDPQDMSGYLEGNRLYSVGTFVEPLVICLFAGGCLVIGIRLQLYVRQVRLSAHTQLRLLLQLNAVLAVVALSYLTRAAFIFNLRSRYNNSIFHCSYVVWVLCTHWLPHFLCSFCLLLLMSRAGPGGPCCCGAGGREVGRNRRKVSLSHGGEGSAGSAKTPRDRDGWAMWDGVDMAHSPLLCEEGEEDGEEGEGDDPYGVVEYNLEGDEEGYERWGGGRIISEEEESDCEESNRDSCRDSYRTDFVDSEYDVNIAFK